MGRRKFKHLTFVLFIIFVVLPIVVGLLIYANTGG